MPCQQCVSIFACFLWSWVIKVPRSSSRSSLPDGFPPLGMWWFWIRGLNRCKSCYQSSNNVRANASAVACLGLIKCVELNGRVETYRSQRIHGTTFLFKEVFLFFVMSEFRERPKNVFCALQKTLKMCFYVASQQCNRTRNKIHFFILHVHSHVHLIVVFSSSPPARLAPSSSCSFCRPTNWTLKKRKRPWQKLLH